MFILRFMTVGGFVSNLKWGTWAHAAQWTLDCHFFLLSEYGHVVTRYIIGWVISCFKQVRTFLHNVTILTCLLAFVELFWKMWQRVYCKACVSFSSTVFEILATYVLGVLVCPCYKHSKHIPEFVTALELLDFCYRQHDDQTQQLLTCELQNWSGQTCLSLAVAANHRALLAHPCSQIILADLWMGGLRTRKNTNLKVQLWRNYYQN